MRLPFTGTQFLDLFAAFNSAAWPVVVLLWAATLVAVVQLMRGRASSRGLALLAAVHWGWSGAVYHAGFFTRINPAAWLFAVVFLIQAVGFLVLGVFTRRLTFDWGRTPRHALAGLFFVYALAYPALVVAAGHHLPAAPAFAVPCPTTLFTAGLLLAAKPPWPRALLVAPIAWSLVGGSAALVLGMTPDVMLFAAAACLAASGVSRYGFEILTRWGATDEDLARPMRADTLVADPNYNATLAIVIAAEPKHIWPWLVQMGYKRGGLYSYDWLDRLFGFLDRPSADRILPEFQTLRAGDVIPVGRGADFPVGDVVPERSLLLGGRADGAEWVWELGLYPMDAHRTTLVSRNRGRMPSTIPFTVFRWLLEFAAFVMTRRMLIGLKQRSERLARDSRGGRLAAA